VSADDTPYWFCDFTTVAANGTGSCFFDGAIPTSLAPGTYYLVVRVDDGGVVSESNENNNVGFFGPITIN
jgi:CARDB protein